MSAKKVIDVDSIYSGGSTKRSRILDDISCSSNVTSAARWTSILSCCWRRNREKKPDFKEYNTNEWDYIVEKLVVKRVPLSLYATEDDFEEFSEEKNYKEFSFGSSMRDKQVYSAMQGMESSLQFFKTKTRGDLSNKPSSKNLRFNRDKDLLDEDTAQAGPSNYDSRDSRLRRDVAANEYLNQFSSLHPDLKENERPPKDPNPLNPPRSKRSLAENISEITSAKKNPIAKPRKEEERIKQGANVYVTVSDTSREISNLVDQEEIPTRDKNVAKHTSKICRKIGSKACLPYPQKVSKTRGVEARQIHQELDSPNNGHKLSENLKDRDFGTKSHEVSQFKAHSVLSEQDSVNKVAKLRPSGLDAGFKSRERNDLELSKSAADGLQVTKATSYTSDDLKSENVAGTTLRWKIIIKHHQPTASQTASETTPGFIENSTFRTINDGFNYRPKLINTKKQSFDKIGVQDDEMDYN